MQRRKRYSQEFKQEAVNLVTVSGATVVGIARDLDINAAMLGRWCREFSHYGQKAFRGQWNQGDAEVAALKRELAKVKKERDFLREAATFFSGESK